MQRAYPNIAVTYLGRKVRFFIQSSRFINGRYFSWPASDNFGSIIGVSVNKPGFVHDLEKFLRLRGIVACDLRGGGTWIGRPRPHLS